MNLMSLPGSHTVRTPWHVLSAAMVQASAWRSSNGTVQTEKVHALTAVGTPMARQPCSVVSSEPVGRTGDEPDEVRVGHDGWARLRAEVATGRALGARGI